MSPTLRSTDPDGTQRELKLTRDQALDLGAGRPIAYFVHDKKVLVDEDGEITVRESTRPIEDAA